METLSWKARLAVVGVKRKDLMLFLPETKELNLVEKTIQSF